MKPSVIVCEGYQDRAFLSGLLKKLDCTNPGPGTKSLLSTDVKHGGIYCFTSPTGGRVEVVPAGSTSKVGQRLQDILKHCDVERALAIVDHDEPREGKPRRSAIDRRLDLIKSYKLLGESAPFALFDKPTDVALWTVPAEVPRPTLERIVETGLDAREHTRQQLSSATAFVDSHNKAGGEPSFVWAATWDPVECGVGLFESVWGSPESEAAMLKVLDEMGTLARIKWLIGHAG